MPQVILRVYLMNDTHKTVYLDPETTTVEELWWTVSQKYNLDDQSAQCFYIWAISKDIEMLLYSEQTIQDIYDDWDAMTEKYLDKPKLLSSRSMRTFSFNTSARLTKSPSGLALENSLGRAPSLEKSRSSIQISRTPSMPMVAAKSGEQVHGAQDVEAFRFVFRPTAVLPVEMEQALVSREAIHLLYIQAVHHVIHSNYPSEDVLAVKLGGVQVQIQYGDQRPEHRGFVREAIEQFVPEHLLPQKRVEEWVEMLSEEHGYHTGKDPTVLERQYLDIVQQKVYYGSTFFRVKHIPALQSFYKMEFQGTVHLGINHTGIHLIEPRAMKVVSWDFHEFVYWDSTPLNFVFEVRTGRKEEPVRMYNFKTNQAHLINDLMHDWSYEWEKKVEERKLASKKDKSKKGDKDKKKEKERRGSDRKDPPQRREREPPSGELRGSVEMKKTIKK
eukprot:TRINITY_DN484_c0_g1_i1.p1 TRINITY_DN484_c0_g1~~TRINITY_DN484_c0_g1_i1.p1  ORF type:complete len:444 (+),score=86.76 TRINITY_DN484_c0_g1_i1:157-1488(+)